MTAQLDESLSDRAAVATLPAALDPLEILRELVAIPSVNPMGREAAGAIYYEHRLTDWLGGFFDRLGVAWERQEVTGGRCNVIARCDRPGATRTILLDAHQDTVPADGMTVEPFRPVVRGGRLYGRGACDVKGGMASMLAAFARLVAERPAGAANVVMACTCDEEFTAKGAGHLAGLWRSGRPGDSLAGAPPDVCLVAEPTDLHVVVAHRGAVRWTVRTAGVACHSSRPHEGVNAIYRMARVLAALEEYAGLLPTLAPPHPLCGGPTLSVGRIAGGTSVNIVPDACSIEIDRRVVPGEDPREVIPHVAAFLRDRLPFEVEMSPSWLDGAALDDGNNGPWADRLLARIGPVAGPRERQGAWYGTNAAPYAAAGVPAIVCGPGSIAQAHTADEWIEVDQLYQAGEIYYRFCID